MRTSVPTVGGILVIATALICLFLAVAWAIWPPLGWLVFRVALVDPYTELLIGGAGMLAFALGFMAGVLSLLRRRFWLAVTCGGLSLIPAFLVLLFTLVILSTKSMFVSSIRFPIWLYLLAIALAPAVVGLILVAISKKEIS